MMRLLRVSNTRGVRGLVLGGAASAAMVALLLAPAFACTGQGSLGITPTSGPPGTVVVMEITFPPAPEDTGRPDEIVVKWGTASEGRVLATVRPNAAGRARAEVVVPADAVPAFYPITAVKMQANGTPLTSGGTFRVRVPAPSPAPPSPNPAPGPLEPVPAVLSPGQGAPAAGAPGTPAVFAAPGVEERAAAGPSSGPRTSPAGDAAPALAPPATIPAEAAPAPADGYRLNGAPAVAAPHRVQDPNAMIGLPSPSDLWSGLDAERAPSLLDAAAPVGQTAPAGPILLGSGGAVLAGLALVAGRQRLAPVARRR